MDDISNDGLNSELEDDEDEDDFQVNNNHLRSNTDDNNNNNNNNLMPNFDISYNNVTIKSKRLNSNKYCKKRKCRTTFTKLQLITLENEFLKSNFVSSDRIELLIEITGLDSRIIKNWFKNKRSRVLADSKGVRTTTSSDTQSVCSSSSSLFNSNQSSASSSSSLIETATINSPLSSINQNNQLYIQTSNLAFTTTTTNNNNNNNNEKVPLKQTSSAKLSNLLHQESEQQNATNPVNIEMINNNKNDDDGLLLNIINNKIENNSNTNIKLINISPPLIIKPKLKCNELSVKKQNFLNHLEWLKDSSCNVCSRFSKLFCICNVSKNALSRLYRNYVGFNSSIFYQDIFNEKHHYNHHHYHHHHQQRCVINNENESKVFEVL